MTSFRTAARAAALLATATMIVSPALAASRPVPISIPLYGKPPAANAWSPADEIANNHRWRRNRGGSTVGNVLTGLLVIGGIAAVASAIDKDQEKRRRDRTQGRDYPYRDGPYDYGDERDEPVAERDYGEDSYGRGDSRAADRAVDACTAEAARTGRVDEVFDVDEVGGEWRVKGDYADGRGFNCTVDRNGRAYVGLDPRAEVERTDRAWDKAGPAQADDRYATGQAPDFEDSHSR